MPKSSFIISLFIISLLQGCVIPGLNFFRKDPFTGGVDQSTSILLDIPMPSSLQYYPSHSKISGGARKEGLEIWRGYIDQLSVAASIYSNLKQHGWQIRLFQRDGERAAYVYERSNELTAIIFLKQGALTIIQIWAGPKLQDGVLVSPREAEPEGVNSMPGEEYPPETSDSKVQESETWGIEEREL